MNGMQEWSSLPCVLTGWGYKDHSLFSEFLKVVDTTQVYTYNHGAELELQNGLHKLSLTFSHVFVTPRHPVDAVRNTFRSPALWLRKCVGWIFTLLTPWFVLGIVLYKEPAPF